MSRYGFEKGSCIEMDIPDQYQVEIYGQDEELKLSHDMAANEMYTICGWTIKFLKQHGTGLIKCSFRKRIRPGEITKLTIHVLPCGPKTEASKPVRLFFVRKDSLYGEKESIDIRQRFPLVLLDSSGLIMIKENSDINDIGNLQETRKVSVSGYSEQDKETDDWQMKDKLQKLEEGIRRMSRESQRLKEQIELREAEYRKQESDIHKKKAELQKKIDDLKLIQENGRLDLETLNREYSEKASELKERFGDSRYALEKLMAYKKGEHSIENLFARIESDLDRMDDILINMIEENEKEDRELAAAIFNNDGKLVR